MKNPSIQTSYKKDLEIALNDLNNQKETWAATPISKRLEILDQIKRDFLSIMNEWVSISLENKGVSQSAPSSSDEWIAGPFPVVRYIRILRDSLFDIETKGLPEIPGPIKTKKDGTLVVQVFPQTFYEKLFFGGITYEVWMQPGENLETLKSNQANIYKTKNKAKLALILGSGNFSAQTAMDILYKCFVENRVVIYKTNPANSYLRPFLEKTFQVLIKINVLRIEDGGAEVGAFLTSHPLVGEIHHTGSRPTFELIKESLKNAAIEKRLTAELGNVGPYIIVPGPWKDRDVAYHAEQLVSTFVANAGFNCSTPRMLILDSKWEKRSRFLDEIRSLLNKVPLRKAFYPGAQKRYMDFLEEHPKSETIGIPGENELPWTIITDVDSEKEFDVCFSIEPFCSIISETSLNSENVVNFLKNSTVFANEKLCGSLVATIIIHPKLLKDPAIAEAFEQSIADLKFGSIGINYWGGTSYLAVVTPWGAFQEINGGETESGVGVVNNALFLANTQKTVLRAPFRIRPKPVWFLSRLDNATEAFQKLTKFEANPSFWKVPSILWTALKPS